MITDGTLSIKSLEWAYIVKKKNKTQHECIKIFKFLLSIEKGVWYWEFKNTRIIVVRNHFWSQLPNEICGDPNDWRLVFGLFWVDVEAGNYTFCRTFWVDVGNNTWTLLLGKIWCKKHFLGGVPAAGKPKRANKLLRNHEIRARPPAPPAGAPGGQAELVLRCKKVDRFRSTFLHLKKK